VCLKKKQNKRLASGDNLAGPKNSNLNEKLQR